MKRLLISIFCFQVVSCTAWSQSSDSTTWPHAMTHFYQEKTPLQFLDIIRNQFNRNDSMTMFVMWYPSPENWVTRQHIPQLMKLIYSTDSTASVVSVISSYLPFGKFSSVGREAQNLVESFRTKSNYPPLWSYGPPDLKKAKELEEWWASYKVNKP